MPRITPDSYMRGNQGKREISNWIVSLLGLSISTLVTLYLIESDTLLVHTPYMLC